MKLDFGVIKALVHYVEYGLHPGSFGMALLCKNKHEAYVTAHHLLKPVSMGGKCDDGDIVANMLAYVEENIPNFICGDEEICQKWIAHQGLMKCPDNTKAVFIMFANNRLREAMEVLSIGSMRKREDELLQCFITK